MRLGIKILAGVLPVVIILLLLLVSILVFCCLRRRRLVSKTTPQFLERGTELRNKESFQAALARIHPSQRSNGSRKAGFYFHLHHHQRQHQHHNDNHSVVAGLQPPFNWNEHPRLITEAVENGWSRFAFTSRPSLAETDWDVPRGSSEFMQTVRLNPRSGGGGDDESAIWCSVRMGLPLPGPPLGGSPFPQEAYFEITILYLQPHHHQQQWSSGASKRAKEGDRVKLMKENSYGDQSDALIDEMKKAAAAAHGKTWIQEPPGTVIKEEGRGREDGGSLVSLGLTLGGDPLPTRSPSPGAYPGSIGFHSNGSVYLDGMELVPESEKTEWTEVNRVIGCGFEPGKKKVFFTVDSHLVHVIHCHSEAYGSPLYPVLSTSADVMVLVNLGQSKFRYAPANAHRTPNPCFLRSASADGGPAVFAYEDSRELFSMGRIDSRWHDGAFIKHGNSSKKGNDGSGIATDDEVESDLFEIALNR